MNLRCRGPDGQVTLSSLDPAMTVAAFQELLVNRLSIPTECQELLAGFPPKPLQVSIADTALNLTASRVVFCFCAHSCCCTETLILCLILLNAFFSVQSLQALIVTLKCAVFHTIWLDAFYGCAAAARCSGCTFVITWNSKW